MFGIWNLLTSIHSSPNAQRYLPPLLAVPGDYALSAHAFASSLDSCLNLSAFGNFQHSLPQHKHPLWLVAHPSSSDQLFNYRVKPTSRARPPLYWTRKQTAAEFEKPVASVIQTHEKRKKNNLKTMLKHSFTCHAILWMVSRSNVCLFLLRIPPHTAALMRQKPGQPPVELQLWGLLCECVTPSSSQ